MRTWIYLVRHAQARSNIGPVFTGPDCLTELGTRQAKATALRLKDSKAKAVYSTHADRSKETAKEIAEGLDIPHLTLDTMEERKGSMDPNKAFVADEGFAALKRRLADTKVFFEEAIEGRVVVVGHAIFTKALIAYLMFGEGLTEEMLVDIDATLVIDNAGITVLMFNKEKSAWRIMSTNDTAHLPTI